MRQSGTRRVEKERPRTAYDQERAVGKSDLRVRADFEAPRDSQVARVHDYRGVDSDTAVNYHIRVVQVDEDYKNPMGS